MVSGQQRQSTAGVQGDIVHNTDLSGTCCRSYYYKQELLFGAVSNKGHYSLSASLCPAPSFPGAVSWLRSKLHLPADV